MLFLTFSLGSYPYKALSLPEHTCYTMFLLLALIFTLPSVTGFQSAIEIETFSTYQPSSMPLDNHDQTASVWFTLFLSVSVMFNLIVILCIVLCCYTFRVFRPWRFVLTLVVHHCDMRVIVNSLLRMTTRSEPSVSSVGAQTDLEGTRGELYMEADAEPSHSIELSICA